MATHDEIIRRLNELTNWVRRFKLTGPHVTGRNGGLNGGAAYHIGAPKVTPGRQSLFEQPLVKITGNASGGGKYTGRLWNRPTGNIPATGNLSEAELGSAATDSEGNAITIRVVNTREVGQSTHDLSSSSYLPLIFPAVFLKTADDGVQVYAIDGRQHFDCSTS